MSIAGPLKIRGFKLDGFHPNYHKDRAKKLRNHVHLCFDSNSSHRGIAGAFKLLPLNCAMPETIQIVSVIVDLT